MLLDSERYSGIGDRLAVVGIVSLNGYMGHEV
jgi:hypothetical protein